MVRQIDRRDIGAVEPQVVRYSERPELWDGIEDLSDEVWPEYNKHGDALNHYWGSSTTCFPSGSSCCMTRTRNWSWPRATRFRWPGTAPTTASGPASTRPSPGASRCGRPGAGPPRPAPWP